MIRVARRYHFSASHRLHSIGLCEQENDRIYGKCNNPYGHGHDYILEIIVKGNADPVTGLVVPLQRLDTYVRRTVLEDFDHKYMNEQIPAFRDVPPTTENVATEIRKRLSAQWGETFPNSPSLDAIRILETRRNTVELNCAVR
jgi:6-pyruvoyltetrahydropterin/6-carboxytetrahydropterin synthase